MFVDIPLYLYTYLYLLCIQTYININNFNPITSIHLNFVPQSIAFASGPTTQPSYLAKMYVHIRLFYPFSNHINIASTKNGKNRMNYIK